MESPPARSPQRDGSRSVSPVGKSSARGSGLAIDTDGSRMSVTARYFGGTPRASSPTQSERGGNYSQFGSRGGKFSNSKPKSDVDWAIYRAKQLPGPGEYKIDMDNKVSGGRFNMSKPKTDVDWIMFNGGKTPGPGEYQPEEIETRVGGKFSSANPKSDLDWVIHGAKTRPGPGAYDPDGAYRVNGGRFSTARPKTDVEWTIHRAKQLPGPGAYAISRDLRPSGGRFSMAVPMTDVDWATKTAGSQPGPQDYEVDVNYRVNGGKFSSAKPPSMLDLAIHKGKQSPGPGEYNSEITSIGRRTGRMTSTPSEPSLPADKRARSGGGIPPEARRQPKPKDQLMRQTAENERGKRDRPMTSSGIPPEARGKMLRPVSAPKPLPPRATSAPPGPRGVDERRVSAGRRPTSPGRRPGSPEMKHGPGNGGGGQGGPRAAGRPPPGGVRPWSSSIVRKEGAGEEGWGEAEGHHAARRPQTAAAQGGHRRGGATSPPYFTSVEEGGEGGGEEDGGASRSTYSPVRPRTAVLPRSSSGGPGRVQKRIPRSANAKLSQRSAAGTVGWTGKSEKARGQLSENARKLFDLAMESAEFRKMMQLYTGVKDPGPLIEKYAATWSAAPPKELSALAVPR